MPRDAEVRSMWRDLLRWMEARLLPDGSVEQAGKNEEKGL
jgi:hypothetical protein